MGQTSSTEIKRGRLHEQLHVMRGHISTFERLSLKKNMEHIGSDGDKLVEVLGIKGTPGANVILRMAQNLTDEQLDQWILVAIGWFDGRLRAALEIGEDAWHELLFNAASSAGVGEERYMSFEDLSELVWLLVSAFDCDPRDCGRGQIELIEPKSFAIDILKKAKSPAVQFAQLNSTVLETYPFLLQGLGNIWDRLLYDEESTNEHAFDKHMNICKYLPRSNSALLYITLGPCISNSFRMFQGTKDGFAMMAFEAGVANWSGPSVLVVRGRQPKNYEKSWAAKHNEIDRIIPRVHDAPLKAAKTVVFAVYVDQPWKSSLKHCFGGSSCTIIQIEPEIHIWKIGPQKICFSSKGVGAGFEHPPFAHGHANGTSLFIDSTMEHAVFRNLPDQGDKFEYRFLLKEVEVLAVGTKSDFDRQQQTREWAQREQRRKSEGSHQDRAILELAGIVGQYSVGQ